MKIAIVGTGGVATRHLGVLRQIPSLELVGHVSAHASRADAQATRWGGKAFTELEHLLDAERPDAVWVCVTPDRHGRCEEALIARNVPFFVEKPLAADLSVPESVAAQLERTSIVVAVGYKFRGLDTLPLVRDMLAERPAHMALAVWHDRTPGPTWWRDASRSGGQVVEQATHLVDLARVLLGDPDVLSAVGQRVPRQAFVDSTVDDVTAALLRFPRNVPLSLTATCLLEGNVAAYLQLICEGRVLTLSERALLIQTGQSTREINSRSDPFLAEDIAFVEAVRTANPSAVLCTYADALSTQRICITIRNLAHSGPPATRKDRNDSDVC